MTLKVIKGSGSIADLLYYLNRAHEENKLKHVFWCMDIFALLLDTEVNVYSEYTPKYLFTDTMLDDFTYLFNKDVLLEKIPLFLAYSAADTYTGGNGYNWAADKKFGAEFAMYAYQKPAVVKEAEELLPHIKLMEENMERLFEDDAWLIEKFDYRNKDADWKNSKEALQNCMQKLKGGYPADPVYKQKK